MKDIKTFIKKAIEGKWRKGDILFNTATVVNKYKYQILLDPLAWQAVGKVEGWGKCPKKCGIKGCAENPDAQTHHEYFINDLWKGKTIEEAIQKI